MSYDIIVEPWSADESYAYVHAVASTGIHSRLSSVITDCTVQQAIEIGFISGKMTYIAGRLSLEGSCHEFCKMAAEVLTTPDKWIAESRGKLEDLVGADLGFLSDLEVSWLDREACDVWRELAYDNNPWVLNLVLCADIEDVLVDYMLRQYPERQPSNRSSTTPIATQACDGS